VVRCRVSDVVVEPRPEDPRLSLAPLAGSEDDRTPTWWNWTEQLISTIRYVDHMGVLADAATVLHEARRRAGLTQAELGRRAGVTQSVVSAYESGRRQPSLPVLLGLLRASGHVLDASLVAAEPAGLSGPLSRRVWQHRHRITAVAASHGVRRVRVFGSVARGTETPGSDVDLLVDLPEGMGLFALGRLRLDLEEIVGARIDLVPADGLRPDVRSNVETDLVTL
jgi:predicted nucleotidyltransferase/DNA-binding XRE family transcriptional regulator